MDHILSSCTTSDDALRKWILVELKMILKKYSALGSFAYVHTALLSDVPTYDPDVLPILEECTDEYDDIEVSVPFTSIAFSSSIALGRGISQS
jgi:hypothetical protein